MNEIELLAPVGSFDALKAAVQNGANAVYLGGKDFSARASANNFDREELIEAVKYAHIRDVRVFVTTNTLIKQDEIEDFVEYAKFLYDIDVDALIMQDIGVAMLIHDLLPDFELHASTQMVAHSLEDVQYLESIGFKRVVLARELTVDEIKYICDNTNVDIEIFVHGALCVCYSGGCLMSSMIGNRSGNRGRCAQPCRQKYTMIDISTGEEIHSNGEYLLSTKDLNTIEDVDKIIETGVLSLKIEGRMKKPEYVATVINSYRNAIDEYQATKKVNISTETMEDLYTIFNRKFTKGLILGEVGEDVMNSNVPNNQGLYVGKVVDYNKKAKRLKIKLEGTLKKGDGINLGGGTIGRIIKGKEIAQIGYKGETIELDFIGEARKNQPVFKTSDTNLIDKAQKTYTQDKEFAKSLIDAEITIKLGEYPELKLIDKNNNSVTVKGDKLVEKALKVALGEEKIETQIKKLGNTPYELDNLKINLDEGVSMPISLINQMRREAIELLDEARIPVKGRAYKDSKIKYSPKKYAKDTNSNSKIRVKINNIEALKSIINLDIDMIYYEDVATLEQAMAMATANNKKLIYSAPRIVRNKEYKRLEKSNEYCKENVQISALGQVKYYKENSENVSFDVDYYLNPFNSETINHYKKEGATTVCISQELNIHEIKETTKYTDMEIETVAYGYIPMMLSEYCPMGVVARSCKKDKRCATCKESKYVLRDFKGEEYRISQDLFCRSTIYNSIANCLINNLDELSDAGINVFRLDFTHESPELISKITKAFINTVNNDLYVDVDDQEIFDNMETTLGHLYKGVE
nr:U32 family peptidase [uncultured Intestinibacter sp.]